MYKATLFFKQTTLLQRFLTYLCVTVLSLSSNILVAQDQGVNYDYLMLQLEADMKLGRTRSLRDMGSLLDQEKQKIHTHQLLKDYTLFLPEEFDLSKEFSKKEFLEFYYANAEEFKFSELLNAFYLTPLEDRESAFSMKAFDAATVTDKALLLRQLILSYVKAREDKEDEKLADILDKISNQGSDEAYLYLADVLKNDILPNKRYPNRRQIAGQLAHSIAHLPSAEILNILLKCTTEELLRPALTASLLANLTNHLPSQATNAELLAQEYRQKLDSLGGFEEMRQAGYSQVYSFGKNFFEFPVDYYGRVLSLSEQRPWLRYNALKDIVDTHHPRALFYIAAQIYQYRDRLDLDKSEFVYRLEQMTELKISIVGRKGKAEEHNWNSDRKAQRNYVTYWASHYEDYEWDEIRKQFINKTEKLELTKNYERLFRRLNSENDSIAMQAWLLLSEGDPVEVIGLANKYKELLRNYNSFLPSFKYHYLEQTVQLTDFCKRNKIRYRPSSRVQFWLKKLKDVKSEKERYQIENRLIETLTIDEVTAVEYWGLINENNKQTSFSVGRILDWYYSENWDKITRNEKELRLYLKKAKLFADIGVIGVCNHYMNKFGLTYTQLEIHLNNLLRVETDTDIIESISFLLYQKQENNHALLIEFIADPLSVNKSEIDNLPEPTEEESAYLFSHILREDKAKTRRILMDYIEDHVSLSIVPHFMLILNKGIEEKRVVSILNKLYNHSFKDKEKGWLAMWKDDERGYKKWEKKFFYEKVRNIEKGGNINVKDLNSIVKSPFYEENKQKKMVLSALSRLERVRDVRRFRVKSELKMPEDLVYFKDLKLTEKELDDIPRLFDLSNPKPMVTFLVNQTENFDLESKGSFFNNLFRSNWFVNYVNDGLVSKHIGNYIREALDIYLNESDLISEFEEQATVRNIALLDISNLPLQEKMFALMQLKGQVGEDAWQQVQKAILSRIDYLDISQIAPFFPELTVLKRYNFLNKDFGLPLFDLADAQVQKELINIHQKNINNQAVFYAYYLDEFGVDYKNEDGKIDYAKIYRILKYDIVTPFVGDGGNRRDFFTYGIIKLLEKEFKTQLDFHSKLNENQTFYSFSATKQAIAWMEYLEGRSLVSRLMKSRSFNWTRVN
ncbi:MAG: hypothetical protein ACI85O_002465 [Saprospiraceae bacterium]|jgi:hypothetical protein